jgi:hypothetical protein
VAVDLIREGNFDSKKKLMMDIIGQYIGSFTVPFRTFADALAHFDPEQAAYREQREPMPVGLGGKQVGMPLAPFFANLPELSKVLPKRPSPLRAGESKAEYPLTRQLTGQSLRTMNPIEQEVERLSIPWSSINPAGGIPELGREYARRMGPIVEKLGSAFVEAPGYKRLNPDWKRWMLENFFKSLRSEITEQIQEERPELLTQRSIKRLPQTTRALLGLE